MEPLARRTPADRPPRPPRARAFLPFILLTAVVMLVVAIFILARVLSPLFPGSTMLPLLTGDTALLIVFIGALVVEVIGGILITSQILDPVLSSLEKENARIRAILGSLADGVVLRDAEGRITLANPAAVDLLDTPRGLQPEALSRIGALPDGEAAHDLVELGERTLAVSSAAVLTESGEYYGDVLVLRDVTHQAMVQRTKDNFLDHVGHELRTPLTVIKGYGDVMRLGGDRLKPEVRERAIDAILEQTETLARMIDEVIELTGLVSGGRRMLHVTTLDIGQLVTETLDDWRPTLRQARIDPHLDNAAPGLTIDGDPRRLRRVLDALLHNACRFSPQGGDLAIAIRQEDGYICLTLADSGVGIAPADLPHIFDRFYRGEPVDERGEPIETRGTGQGLYAVKTIVEAHGGSIQAASTVGSGTVITLRLPLAASQ